MPNHRLVLDRGDGSEARILPIPPSGISVGLNGVEDGAPIFRIDLEGDEAVLYEFYSEAWVKAGTIQDGDGFWCGADHYIYRSREGDVFRGTTFHHKPPRSLTMHERPKVYLDCPDKFTERLHDRLLTIYRLSFASAKFNVRAAIVFDRQAPNGRLLGTYWPEIFPIDLAVIVKARSDRELAIINEDRSACCIPMPFPDQGFLYVEGDRPHWATDDVVAETARVVDSSKSFFDSLDQLERGSWRGWRLMKAESGPMPGAYMRFGEPGCTIGPDVYISVKDGDTTMHDERIANQRTLASEPAGHPGVEISFTEKPMEMLRSIYDASPSTLRAAVLFTYNTSRGRLPDFFYPRPFTPVSDVDRVLEFKQVPFTSRAGVCGVALGSEKPFGILYTESKDGSDNDRQGALLKNIATQYQDGLEIFVEGSYPIVGESGRMRALKQFIAGEAMKDAPVLIQGEAGTGRRTVARAIHLRSRRWNKPFLSEIGSMSSPDGGTLFLSDIDHSPPDVQELLLHFLDTGEFRRLRADVRLIIGASLNLERAVSEGQFSEELYIRISGARFVLPRLSDRQEDIPALAKEFVARYSRRRGQTMDADAIAVLQARSWPTNVSGLRMTIEQAVAQCEADTIRAVNL